MEYFIKTIDNIEKFKTFKHLLFKKRILIIIENLCVILNQQFLR